MNNRKYDCDIVQDLLPLYQDSICSNSSRKMIEEHLKECEECSHKVSLLKNTKIDESIEKERDHILSTHAKRERKKLWIVGIVTAVLLIIAFLMGVSMFCMSMNPYNENGVNKYLNISIDEDCGKTYIGTYSGYEVYTYHLKDAYFINFDAGTISLEQGLGSEIVSLEEMLSVGDKEENASSIKRYAYENYEIILDGNECVIEPKE